jgi:hypothetical protein
MIIKIFITYIHKDTSKYMLSVKEKSYPLQCGRMPIAIGSEIEMEIFSMYGSRHSKRE